MPGLEIVRRDPGAHAAVWKGGDSRVRCVTTILHIATGRPSGIVAASAAARVGRFDRLAGRHASWKSHFIITIHMGAIGKVIALIVNLDEAFRGVSGISPAPPAKSVEIAVLH